MSRAIQGINVRRRGLRSLAVAAVALAMFAPIPAPSAVRSFDLVSDALGVLPFLDFGSGVAVPVDPKMPHTAAQIRRTGSARDASGVAAWLDPGFILGALFVCNPLTGAIACRLPPGANPYDQMFAASNWPQPPPQEQKVGINEFSSPILTADAANAASKSGAAPSSTNEANISNLVIGSGAQSIRIANLRATSESVTSKGIVTTTSRTVLSGIQTPGGAIDTIAVEVSIRSDGTARGTKQTARVAPAGALSALDLGAVKVRPPFTCTGPKCRGKEVVGFDFISGTQFCSRRGQACALAVGPEIEFNAGGQRYVITLGRAWAQGSAQR